MPEQTPQRIPAGLPRRLAALFYDLFLLIAILYAATAVVTIFNDGVAPAPNNPLFTTYLFFISFFFFGWFWMHGGQTLGMQTWKVRLVSLNGRPITWWQVLLRFLVAIPSAGLFGLGYFWMLVDRKKLTWHDRYSETTIVLVDKKPKV